MEVSHQRYFYVSLAHMVAILKNSEYTRNVNDYKACTAAILVMDDFMSRPRLLIDSQSALHVSRFLIS